MQLVGGWGINDLGYPVAGRSIENGVSKFKVLCPFYIKWQSMINRTHSHKYQENQVTYIESEITEEWKYATAFKSWMETQDWHGYQLDKDILVQGNKIYSPETCCFVPQYVNKMLTQRTNFRGEYPLGVHYNEAKQPYVSTCHDGNGKVYLGRFSNPVDAHKAWQAAKPSSVRACIYKWVNSERPPNRKDVVEALLARAEQIELDLLTGRITEYF